MVAGFNVLDFEVGGYPAARANLERTNEIHPQAGSVARLRCNGPTSAAELPQRLPDSGQRVWAQARARFFKRLDLGKHRALGLWVHGDGGGETLGIRLDIDTASCLHYYLPIEFTGWRYCELGEPEGDRVMDYFSYEKFALHDVPLDNISGVTLMILHPPVGKQVDLRIGRIEAIQEVRGSLVNIRIDCGAAPLRAAGQTRGRSLAISATLEPEQSVETGDLWGRFDPSALRIFDGDGIQLHRAVLPFPPPVVPTGDAAISFSAHGHPAARAKVTVMLLGGL